MKVKIQTKDIAIESQSMETRVKIDITCSMGKAYGIVKLINKVLSED